MTDYQILCAKNGLNILGPQMRRYRQIVTHHYKHRHDGRGSASVKNWIQALRDFDKGCGYSQTVRNLQKSGAI